MRQKLNSVLLGAAVVLLALNVIALYQSRSPVLPVYGQTGDIMMAASNTQNEAFCFMFDKSKNKLVSYMQRTNGGLDLMGIRSLEYDFPEKISEYPPSRKQTAVKNMRQLADQISAAEKRSSR